MSGVEFFEESSYHQKSPYDQTFGQEKSSLFASLLIKMGIVKTPQAASYVLIGAAFVFFLAAAIIFYMYVFHGSLLPTATPPHLLFNGQRGIRGHEILQTTTPTANALLY